MTGTAHTRVSGSASKPTAHTVLGETSATMATEHAEQAALIQWADINPDKRLRRLFAIPNAAKRSFALASYMKSEGLRKGVLDLCLPIPSAGYHGAYLEMKSKDGKMTPEQQDWKDFFDSQGYATCVAYSFEEAKDFLTAYLWDGV
jgi:VRR-NUC domain-containing protein